MKHKLTVTLISLLTAMTVALASGGPLVVAVGNPPALSNLLSTQTVDGIAVSEGISSAGALSSTKNDLAESTSPESGTETAQEALTASVTSVHSIEASAVREEKEGAPTSGDLDTSESSEVGENTESSDQITADNQTTSGDRVASGDQAQSSEGTLHGAAERKDDATSDRSANAETTASGDRLSDRAVNASAIIIFQDSKDMLGDAMVRVTSATGHDQVANIINNKLRLTGLTAGTEYTLTLVNPSGYHPKLYRFTPGVGVNEYTIDSLYYLEDAPTADPSPQGSISVSDDRTACAIGETIRISTTVSSEGGFRTAWHFRYSYKTADGAYRAISGIRSTADFDWKPSDACGSTVIRVEVFAPDHATESDQPIAIYTKDFAVYKMDQVRFKVMTSKGGTPLANAMVQINGDANHQKNVTLTSPDGELVYELLDPNVRYTLVFLAPDANGAVSSKQKVFSFLPGDHAFRPSPTTIYMDRLQDATAAVNAPRAELSLDKSSYQPGDTVTISLDVSHRKGIMYVSFYLVGSDGEPVKYKKWEHDDLEITDLSRPIAIQSFKLDGGYSYQDMSVKVQVFNTKMDVVTAAAKPLPMVPANDGQVTISVIDQNGAPVPNLPVKYYKRSDEVRQAGRTQEDGTIHQKGLSVGDTYYFYTDETADWYASDTGDPGKRQSLLVRFGTNKIRLLVKSKGSIKQTDVDLYLHKRKGAIDLSNSQMQKHTRVRLTNRKGLDLLSETDSNGMVSFYGLEPKVDYQLKILTHDPSQQKVFHFCPRRDYESYSIYLSDLLSIDIGHAEQLVNTTITLGEGQTKFKAGQSVPVHVKITGDHPSNPNTYTYTYSLCDFPGHVVSLLYSGDRTGSYYWKTPTHIDYYGYLRVDVFDSANKGRQVSFAEIPIDIQQSNDRSVSLAYERKPFYVTHEAIVFNAITSNQSGPVSFKYYVSKAAYPHQEIDTYPTYEFNVTNPNAVSSSQRFNWIPSSPGLYQIRVETMDKDGLRSSDDTWIDVITNNFSLETFHVLPVGLIHIGSPLWLSAKVSGGAGNLTYTFKMIDKAGRTEVIEDNSTSNQVKWTPRYPDPAVRFILTVKDELGRTLSAERQIVTVDDFKVDQLNVSPESSCFVNEQVTISANAVKPTGKMKYRFYKRSADDKIQYLTGFLLKPTFVWRPTEIEKVFWIGVEASDEAGQTIRKEVPYKVTGPQLAIKALTADPPGGCVVGSTIRVKAEIASEFNDVQYRFYSVDKDGQKQYWTDDFTSNATSSWTYKSADTDNLLGVEVRDSRGIIVEKSLHYPVKPEKVKILSFTTNPPGHAIAGDTVEMKVHATGGLGALSYRFFVRTKQGKIVYLNKKFSRNNILKWRTSLPNEWYWLGVMATDLKGGFSYKLIPYPIRERQLKITAFNASPHPQMAVAGDTVKMYARASGGNGSIKYRFFIRTSDGKQIYLNKKFTKINQLYWRTSQPNNGYWLGVVATDSKGTVAYKLFPYPIG